VPALGQAPAVVAITLSAVAACAPSDPSVARPTDEGSTAFSFFLTSLGAMRTLASEHGVGEQGFGGDLRYGEDSGLAGADRICRTIAESAAPEAAIRDWRAFLSTQRGGDGDGPVHAIDRVGDGPWHDRLGRLVAATKTDLLAERPLGAHPLIANDLPNEHGVPNHKDGAPLRYGDQQLVATELLTG
jgi:hypothetical protein